MAFQEVVEVAAGPATGVRRHVLGTARGDDLAAAVAAFGAEVDDPVGRLHDVEVVLDDDDGVALVGQFMEHLQELLHVLEVQARGGLVEDVEGLAGGPARQFLGELDPLRLAARQRGGRLPPCFSFFCSEILESVAFWTCFQ